MESLSKVFDRARKGDLSVLDHPEATTALDGQWLTPLHWLARTVKFKDVDDLLSRALVQTAMTRDGRGRTPLHELARRGGFAPAKVILHPLVTLGMSDKEWTALHELAHQGVEGVITHPDVATAKDEQGKTPLHVLAATGSDGALTHPMVAIVRDKDGWTPLHYLAVSGCKSALEHPKVKTVKDRWGETPYDYAPAAMESAAHER